MKTASLGLPRPFQPKWWPDEPDYHPATEETEDGAFANLQAEIGATTDLGIECYEMGGGATGDLIAAVRGHFEAAGLHFVGNGGNDFVFQVWDDAGGCTRFYVILDYDGMTVVIFAYKPHPLTPRYARIAWDDEQMFSKLRRAVLEHHIVPPFPEDFDVLRREAAAELATRNVVADDDDDDDESYDPLARLLAIKTATTELRRFAAVLDTDRVQVEWEEDEHGAPVLRLTEALLYVEVSGDEVYICIETERGCVLFGADGEPEPRLINVWRHLAETGLVQGEPPTGLLDTATQD